MEAAALHLVGRYTLRINGKRVATLPSTARAATIDMSGRARQIVSVSLTTRTTTGAIIGTKRVYRTCRHRLPADGPDTLVLQPVKER